MTLIQTPLQVDALCEQGLSLNNCIDGNKRDYINAYNCKVRPGQVCRIVRLVPANFVERDY